MESMLCSKKSLSIRNRRHAGFLFEQFRKMLGIFESQGIRNCIHRSFTSTYSEIGLKQSKMWPAGTLCITIAANIANTGILTFDACFPGSVVGFCSLEKGRVEYVQSLFWFLRDILERKAPQVAQKNINLKILRNLPVPVPPLDL